jgi:AcrR family transcriptional regulator
MARTGRRPGNQDTREAILAAARAAFADNGYDRASIRMIATGAGVDPALVHHYFGSKDQLFLASMQVPIDPTEVIPRVIAGGRDGVGERLVRTFLGVWDSPAGVAGAALMRSALTNDQMARLLREFIVQRILRRAMMQLGVDPDEVPLRASLVATQIAGLAMGRYLIKIEPLASVPAEVVVAAIGPTIQRYLLGPISAPTSASVPGTRAGLAPGHAPPAST